MIRETSDTNGSSKSVERAGLDDGRRRLIRERAAREPKAYGVKRRLSFSLSVCVPNIPSRALPGCRVQDCTSLFDRRKPQKGGARPCQNRACLADGVDKRRDALLSCSLLCVAGTCVLRAAHCSIFRCLFGVVPDGSRTEFNTSVKFRRAARSGRGSPIGGGVDRFRLN